jgi:hypothetical protein
MPAEAFARVARFGQALPDVELATSWGQPALKVRGTMFVCLASHKSAEPNTLVARMDIAVRDLLLEDAPAIYYLTPHYVDDPCVLVRLERVSDEALRDVLRNAHRFVGGGSKTGKRVGRSRGGTRRPLRLR